MFVGVNPTYLCNFRCDFCYLTKNQLEDKTLLDLDVLDYWLKIIHTNNYKSGIEVLDLYGGEITLLDDLYSYKLMKICKKYSKQVNVITNLLRPNHPLVQDLSVELSVSYEFKHRERHEQVYHNMMALQRPFRVTSLAFDKFMLLPIEEILDELNRLPNIKSWEIRPYSTNQANSFSITYKDFENYVIKVIETYRKKQYKFELVNIDKLERALDKENNSFTDDVLFITPDGNLAVLDFDYLNREYFRKLPDYAAFVIWSLEEKAKVIGSPICGNCKYLGHCLSEHLRPVKSLAYSCNGFFNLLEWYNDSYLETKTNKIQP